MGMSKTPAAGILRIPCRGCSLPYDSAIDWVGYSKIVSLFHTLALFQILLGGGEHELDSVELVDFAGTGIVINCHDVGGRICLPQGLDNALTYDVVRQAAEGLGTYDVRYAFLDQLDHLTG